ncbi:response regulator transcription factor [Thermoclostridium caenicola]|uniref:Stage 0 sporulation protein A homolog n=1 Tax=Thermoclostridium caenicola TaxID=659425 RepID=A0A1M6GGK8_9FIRM|nr:response regulator transcription factor [Thermoclostridium caenicola]SHJ09038.1 two component transcriptional regulator, LuxR family [Thermoclostridium caenicola]
MNMIKVMLVEDHSMIREGLKQLLELEKDIKVIAGFPDGRSAVEQYPKVRPDVVLMDINLPVLNGLEATELIRKTDPQAKIIMLTIHHDREYLLRSLDLGAMGYILKDADSRVLVEAVRSVFNNQTYIQPSMAKELVSEYKRIKSGTPDRPESFLTKRELEVLRLLTKGMLNKEIAKTLYISEKTVKNHISSIFRKLDVQDRTQAAVYAIRHRIGE